ncbi:MAG: hypothetical protein IPN42_14140 [Methylococcaceae bacterium]|nr:hypothetical protein [Methylococcaceae bacterium]
MKKMLFAMGILILFTGCVTERTVVRHTPGRVTYVRPVYPAPGPGYFWRHNPRYGWGWYHHRRGWHRGWH